MEQIKLCGIIRGLDFPGLVLLSVLMKCWMISWHFVSNGCGINSRPCFTLPLTQYDSKWAKTRQNYPKKWPKLTQKDPKQAKTSQNGLKQAKTTQRKSLSDSKCPKTRQNHPKWDKLTQSESKQNKTKQPKTSQNYPKADFN